MQKRIESTNVLFVAIVLVIENNYQQIQQLDPKVSGDSTLCYSIKNSYCDLIYITFSQKPDYTTRV